MNTALEASSPMAGYLYELYEAGNRLLYHDILSGLEAAFYNRVKVTPETAGDLTRLVNRFATNNFTALQFTFTCFNGFLTVSTVKQIIDLSDSPIVQRFSQEMSSQGTIVGYLPAAAIALIMLYSSSIISSRFMQNPSSKALKSKTQIFSGAVQVTGIINSLALAALTQNKVSLLLRAAFNAYSFIKTNKINWLVFTQSRSFVNPILAQPANIPLGQRPQGAGLRIKQIDLSYSALLPHKPLDKDDCSICLEEGPDQVFCTNGHTFHRECLEGHIKASAEFFCRDNLFKRTEIKHYSNGVHTGTSWSYEVDVPENNLPSCPNCRERPPQHKLGITVHDVEKGKHEANVKIIKQNPKSSQRTFEKVNAIYNTFQAALASLQQIPEFAPAVTTLRSYLMVTDILSVLIANGYLLGNLEKNNQRCLYSFASAALATIPVYLAFSSLFTPTGDLSSLTSSEVMAQWQTPSLVKLHQWINTYRLLTTAMSIRFSQAHKAFNVTSLVTQGIGLWGAYSLPWLRVEQSKLATDYEDIKDASINTYALVSSYAANSRTHLQTIIQNIVDLQRNILSESGWKRVTTSVNFVTSRSITLSYNSMPKITDLREYITKAFLWSFGGSATDNAYGELPIEVQGIPGLLAMISF